MRRGEEYLLAASISGFAAVQQAVCKLGRALV
jgi:hypothetical protein